MERKINSPTPLILHGHFYQPPRENPLTQLIGKQSSAAPYADWNERIHDDCYRANAFSRYLNAEGQIVDIINNYSYISFNIGPTLLSWIEKYHYSTYQKILEADAASLQRLGYGNAIAQAYNHTILPLDAPSDALTQIQWGLDDFFFRFQREALGMWLPETAINPTVVSLLVSMGVKFVILSPYQVKAIEQPDGRMKDVQASQVPYERPYLIQGSDNTELAAFFYHGDLASSISFGHMLRSADQMYESLLSICRTEKPQLLHTATDGEIYGHHEPFGDMALAALIKKVESKNDFEFTNYAKILSTTSATLHAVLHQGEEQKGTSWSCSHGVSRWYKDCGCNTGSLPGWNQKWRTPLRQGFNEAASFIDTTYAEQITALLGTTIDAQKLLRAYIKVVSQQMDISAFFDQWEIEADVRPKVAKLLAGQLFKHFSFTSCGWFFNDIGGLEPRQDIHYALTALQLYKEFGSEDAMQRLLQTLSGAKSNTAKTLSGKTIAVELLKKTAAEAEAAAYFLLNHTVARPIDRKQWYGIYKLISFSKEEEQPYRIEICNTLTLTQSILYADAHIDADNGYIVDLSGFDSSGATQQFTPDDIPPRMLEEVYHWIDLSLSQISDEGLYRIARDIRHYSLLMKRGRLAPAENLYVENMGTCLRAIRSLFTTPDTLDWQHKKTSISYLLSFIQLRGSTPERRIAERIFTDEIERISKEIDTKGFTEEKGNHLLDVLSIALAHGFKPSMTKAQEAIFPLLGNNTSSPSLTKLHTALNFSALLR